MPSNYEVFNYWKNEMVNGDMVIIDWGEPSCWCCNKPIIVETEALLKKGDFKTIWNKTSGLLQRCHIVPKSLGGSPQADNLFLMCPKCHSEAPNTDSRESFLRWVSMKRKFRFFGYDLLDLTRGVEDACNEAGIDIESFSLFVTKFDLFSLLNRVSTHGSKLTQSSLVMLLIEQYENDVSA